MRTLATFTACALLSAQSAFANPQVDRLIDAMGLPALIQIFATEGRESRADIDRAFLNGQGGDVFAQTVSSLYDPVRLDQELRLGMAEALDTASAEQALLFFESDLGQRIVDLEVQGRQTMMDDELEEVIKSAPSAQSEAVTTFLEVRDLVERNTETAMEARIAFINGMVDVTGNTDVPDLEAQRGAIQTETESWLRGYYALAQSPLSAEDVATYTAFWETNVGKAVDDAMFKAFGASYSTLSFALGQAVARLMPQNEL